MADFTSYIREYIAFYTEGDDHIDVRIHGSYEDQKTFSPVPTPGELGGLFGVDVFRIDITSCFSGCVNMIAAPKLPTEIYGSGLIYTGLYEIFKNCTSLKIPPKIPATKTAYYAFDGCSALLQAPVIPEGIKDTPCFFRGCTSLAAPSSLPKSVSYMKNMFEGCSAMTGEMIVRRTSGTVTDALKNTVKPITLYGDQSFCSSIAATANNGNAAWAPWYDPIPAVTNRGPGAYTTAADMTRMVRNGALAVNTYAPGRMVYQTGDIVREDEWLALVEAAKTIDPTVTTSTNYANLNKIEAAFDSAL